MGELHELGNSDVALLKASTAAPTQAREFVGLSAYFGDGVDRWGVADRPRGPARHAFRTHVAATQIRPQQVQYQWVASANRINDRTLLVIGPSETSPT